MEVYMFLLVVALTTLVLCDDNACNVMDFENLPSAIKTCSSITISNLKVPQKKTLKLTGLSSGTSVTFEGIITFEFGTWEGPLVEISGDKFLITGAPGHVLDGNGPLWWDGLGKPDNEQKKIAAKIKPKFITLIGVNNSFISDLNIKNSPMHCFTFYSCNNVSVSKITIDNSDGNELIEAFGKKVRRGHNTDGFDIGKESKSHEITIDNCTVINQDDCLAVNAGYHIVFTNNVCIGGHGISIGSVGGWKENEVDRVVVENCSVLDSVNGIRIKTKVGASGRVSDVTFRNVAMHNISRFGIVMQGNYVNGSAKGEPSGGVPITNLTLKNVFGTVFDKGTNVFILVKNASRWQWSDVNIVGGTVKKECSGIPPNSGAFCSP